MRHLLGTVLLASVLAACGGGGGDPASDSKDRIDLPACSEQWVEGSTVTKEFADGCAMDKRTFVVATTRSCDDGGTFVHSPFGYGIVGQEAHLTAPDDDEPDVNSKDYQRVQAACSGQAAS